MSRHAVADLYSARARLQSGVSQFERWQSAAPATCIVATTLADAQDGRLIEVPGSILAMLAKDRLPQMRAELAYVESKIAQIERVLEQ